MRLKGRIALVTGSSRGIGAAIAKKLAAEGASLVLHARETDEQAQQVAGAIRSAGGEAHIVLGDLTTPEAPLRVVQEAFAVHGALDILVCNAGGSRGGLVVNQQLADIDATLALNLRAVMLSVGEFARLTQSDQGRIVLISSGAAAHPAYGASGLSAAKAGAEAFIRAAAQELGERGITANTVAPGTTKTDRIAGQAWTDKVPPWTALRRLGEPEDIADIVAFVVSHEARWLTGATLPASGGLLTTAANILALDQR
ncbi:SDR family oxidoreductase [Mangrovimicrobium sediminis]|uniref:SDR family oxidoreductase n=1 Tax=Mangrovimicrobium sediminis TaxID=2562682 RepID=A0A4Z0LVX9_9GAMM|nr:SDR family oxidoreductase [Haliea sp. SAOS-164]TGD71384.1 SDR family oxidoreductase [Haliea sp. SAOS-164]